MCHVSSHCWFQDGSTKLTFMNTVPAGVPRKSWAGSRNKAKYCIVGNFCKEFIFIFITSQKPFVLNKSVNLSSMESKSCFNLALLLVIR